jgi:DNA invertase Pin-like site-specific DNA recombinase
MSQLSTPKRAALYLRQSLDRAEGIDSQLIRCTKLVEARGWDIVATFKDNEIRASKPRGPETGWGQMLPRIGKDFTVVIAVDLDRLLRNTRDLNTLIDLGAGVVTVDGEIDLSTADGEFRGTMLAGIARFESRRASERQKRSKQHASESGKWHGGIPPYGYSAKDGALVEANSEVKLIKEAAKRLLENYEPMHAIIADWNSPKVPGGSIPKHKTRGGHHWRQSNLRHILMNRAMLGETKAGAVGWKPIIEQDTFDRLQALLTDPSRKVTHSPGVKGGKYSMGGGLTVCGKCGKPLITSTKSGGGVGKRPSLSCLRRVHGPSERHPQVQRIVTRDGEKVEVWQDTGRVAMAHDLLENYVFYRTIALLKPKENWQFRKAEKDPGVDAKIEALNERRTALAERLDRTEDFALDGLISKAKLKASRDSINSEVEEIGREIGKLVGKPSAEEVFGKADRILALWPKWTPGKRRDFFKFFIDRVVVDEWPQGVPRSFPQARNESAEAYAARKDANLAKAVEKRVRIEWREDA